MITERNLKKWRKDALKYKDRNKELLSFPSNNNVIDIDLYKHEVGELNARILLLTQELLDKYLIMK